MHKSLFSFLGSSKYPAGIIGLLSLFILFSACSKPPPHQAILILLDAARPDHFSSYGYGKDTTPEMDALVRDDVYTKEDIRYLNALYDGGLKYTDSQVGRLAHFLKSIHRLNSTLIVVTADHGEMLLDRPGKIGHGETWFGLRQIGFIPEKSFALKDPDYKKRMERLKQLGYIK